MKVFKKVAGIILLYVVRLRARGSMRRVNKQEKKERADRSVMLSVVFKI